MLGRGGGNLYFFLASLDMSSPFPALLRFLQQIMKDKWINIGYEGEELKPYTEPEEDLGDTKRIGEPQQARGPAPRSRPQGPGGASQPHQSLCCCFPAVWPWAGGFPPQRVCSLSVKWHIHRTV